MKTKVANKVLGENPVRLLQDDDGYEFTVFGYSGAVTLKLYTHWRTKTYPKDEIAQWYALAQWLHSCAEDAEIHNDLMSSKTHKPKKGPKGPKA